jgi:putative pre-16S rRNA nuclease
LHRDRNYCNRANARPWAATGWCTLKNVRALGIDFGKRRIGLALSDPTGLLARPWKAIARRGEPQAVADELARMIAELREEDDGLAAVVLGLPLRLSGDPTDLTEAVRALADQLNTLTSVPVILQDERLSSREAESLLARRERDWHKRKAVLDATAAAVILQDYLDAAASSRPSAEEDENRS